MSEEKLYKVKVHFLGAAKTVTGSKLLIETPDINIMIDCGMFQGIKELRKRNWQDIPFDASKIDIVLLTHGHLDHIGYLPRLYKQGFRGEIRGTAPTLEIAKIILNDSARIHEEEAQKANEEHYVKHQPALPLYTVNEVVEVCKLFENDNLKEWIILSDTIRYRHRPVGHILGATFIELEINQKMFVFSGDIGRPNDRLLYTPEKPKWADILFLESTYGDRLHSTETIDTKLISIIKEIVRTGGTLIIPSFAVERLQAVMYILWMLFKKNKIPGIPVYTDSPMGNNVSSIFERFLQWHKLSPTEYRAMCNHINIVTSYRETWEVIDTPGAKVIIAGSGMVTGGRVLTYLKQLVDKPTTHILLVGYQAYGTRGRQLQEGNHELKIYGKYYPVKAQVHQIESLSAHADQSELLAWISSIKNIPENVFLIHGDPGAADTFRVKLWDTLKWKAHIPELNEVQEFLV